MSTEAIKMWPKGKVAFEDESNEALKDIDWKLVRVVQRYQKEQEKDFSLDRASPLSKEIMAETFLTYLA